MFEYEGFDFDKDAVDSIVLGIAKIAEDEDRKTAVIVPQRMMQFMYAYKLLKHITMGTNAKVTYSLHEPYKSMGYISIEGDFEVFNMELFKKAVELASNLEVYAKTDGTVQMNLAFHGLARAIE